MVSSVYEKIYQNRRIESRKNIIDSLTKTIKENSREIGVPEKDYKKLPEISSRDDVRPWITYGFCLEDIARSKKSPGKELNEITSSYLKLAREIEWSKGLYEISGKLAEIVLDKKE